MTIANVTLTNTFDEWRTRTNQLIGVYSETNTLAIAAFNSTNTVTFTAANLAAEVLISNTIILSAITDTVNTAVPVIMTTNTEIITLITDSANLAASNVDYAGIILANSSIMNEINLASSAAASNAITSNTIVIDTIYNNANNIVEGFIANTDVGAAFITANAAFDQANVAFDQANTAYIVANAAFDQANSTTFAANLVISVADNTNAALRITQTGTGNALLIEDVDNPNVTPFIVDANGNVGIGTANTSYFKLNIDGTINAAAVLVNGEPLTGGGSTITLNEDSVDETRYIGFVNAISGDASTINVSSTKLTFNPNTGTLSATIFNSLSDFSLKDNVIRIGGALDTIKSLEGVSFQWKNNGMRSYGVIAQDLEKHIPDLVGNVNGTKNVNYDGIIAFLIEAIKELSRKLDEK
jgi:hypothetical protein